LFVCGYCDLSFEMADYAVTGYIIIDMYRAICLWKGQQIGCDLGIKNA
jgi:hypothetical protein